MRQTVLIRTPLFDMMLLCHVSLYKLVLGQSMKVSVNIIQTERHVEMLATTPAVIGFLITIQNTMALPKVLRHKRAWSIRFYDSTVPICYLLTMIDFLVLLFQMTADQSDFLDRADDKKVLSDSIMQNLAILYFGLLSFRMLFSGTVSSI